MLRPLFRLATREPQLLAGHLEAYTELATSELGVAVARWKRQLALRLLGFTGMALALLLAGVALMLWAVLPASGSPQAWLLWAVPAAPGTIGALALLIAATAAPSVAFDSLRRQWAADASMLREAGSA